MLISFFLFLLLMFHIATHNIISNAVTNKSQQTNNTCINANKKHCGTIWVNHQKLFKAKAGPFPIYILKIEIRDRTTSKYIEKYQGKLIQQSIRPLQGNGMAAISKSSSNSSTLTCSMIDSPAWADYCNQISQWLLVLSVKLQLWWW